MSSRGAPSSPLAIFATVASIGLYSESSGSVSGGFPAVPPLDFVGPVTTARTLMLKGVNSSRRVSLSISRARLEAE